MQWSEDRIGDSEVALAQARRSERRLLAQYAVTRVLAESATLQDPGLEILRAIGESREWALAMFWTVGKDAQLLRFVDLWHAPQVERGNRPRQPGTDLLTRGRSYRPRLGERLADLDS